MRQEVIRDLFFTGILQEAHRNALTTVHRALSVCFKFKDSQSIGIEIGTSCPEFSLSLYIICNNPVVDCIVIKIFYFPTPNLYH